MKPENKNKFRNNLLFSIVGLSLLILLLFYYKSLQPGQNEMAPILREVSRSENPVITQAPGPSILIEENKETQKVQSTGKFPPVYGEENITRPNTIEKTEDRPQNHDYGKVKAQASGPAAISFVYEDKKVKITLFEGEVQALVIDDELISQSDYISYTNIINKGRQLEKNSREENQNSTGTNTLEREQKRQNEIINNTIIKSLAKDGLISPDAHFDFRLVWYNVYINGRRQPMDVYEKYKVLYEEASGKRLMPGSDVYIKH